MTANATILLALLVGAQDPALPPGAPNDRDADAVVKKLREDFAGASIERKVAAAQTALQCEHEKVVRAVADLLPVEADSFRIPVAAALGDVDHPAAAEALARALPPNVPRLEVATALVKAIAHLGWQSACGPLHELVRRVGEPDVREVLPEVLRTVAQLGNPLSIDVLVDLLEKLDGLRKDPWPNEKELRRGAEEALRAVTGQSFKRVDDWKSWWRTNQEILKQRTLRTYWLRKTQQRVEVFPGEKGPADALVVASRLVPPPSPAKPPKTKKK